MRRGVPVHAPRPATRGRSVARGVQRRVLGSDEGFFVLALDGSKAPVRSVTSNPAHCLYCGIVDDDKAPLVAERLMAPDMFPGWGIRTLSSTSTACNPMSYHNGSVWPHDNAIAAAGLKRYGFDAGAARIASGMFDVASGARDFRLPELFCGFGRDESRAIVAYPVACLAVERPRLPEWLSGVEIRDIDVGDSCISLSFRRTDSNATGFSLLDHRGDVQVTMSA